MSDTIQSYSLTIIPYSNYIRYSRYYIILNTKSQRYGEYIRHDTKYDAFQVSVSDLENLYLKKERLKLERDLAFEVIIAGLERVYILEKH